MTREEKIAELINIRDNFNYTLAPREVFDDAIEALLKEPKTGHWITQWNPAHQKEYYYCPECREEYSYDGETGIKMNDYNYCPNCGTKMNEPKGK